MPLFCFLLTRKGDGASGVQKSMQQRLISAFPCLSMASKFRHPQRRQMRLMTMLWRGTYVKLLKPSLRAAITGRANYSFLSDVMPRFHGKGELMS